MIRIKPYFIVHGWTHLVYSLMRSMYFWAKKGFTIVPYYVSQRRQLICKRCTGGVGHRCPICGCFIAAISKLTSSHCENWNKYLDSSTQTILTNDISPTEH